MEKIEVFVKVKPLTYPSGIRIVKTKDELHGPNSLKCTCGNNYSAFIMNPGTEFDAFQNALQILARSYMKKNGLIRPLAGPIAFNVVVGCQRPLKHFDSTGLLDDYKYRVPMKLPAFYKILESASKALYGVAFSDMKQIGKSSFTRVYRESESIEIIIEEVNPSDVDPEIKQLELF